MSFCRACPWVSVTRLAEILDVNREREQSALPVSVELTVLDRTHATEVDLLQDVDVPTLIAWGVQDRNKSPEELAQLRAGLRNNTVIEVASAGHYVHEEAPEVVAKAMADAKYLW